MSLRRVPPNILVGGGAKDFAYEHGIPLLPNDFLVSRNAHDRFVRWSEDLKRVGSKETRPSHSPEQGESVGESTGYDKDAQKTERRDHLNAIFTGTWNEGQPDSPARTPSTPMRSGSPSPTAGRWPPSTSPVVSPGRSSTKSPARSLLAFSGHASSGRARARIISNANAIQLTATPSAATVTQEPNPNISSSRDSSTMGEEDEPWNPGRSSRRDSIRVDQVAPPFGAGDKINDTVGAIAIDLKGNLAAGSSSGGIGMKHSGRIGPAALVGVGTAVLPADLEDEDSISVAAITSGTGEHMATTMASHKCAERLYYNNRRGPGGRPVVDYNEDNLMESFIVNDFMNHPGVKNQNAAGAIGVMAVKKTCRGHFLYFAHNTDSFALASMASTEKEPLLVMSRLKEGSNIARGGRKIKLS